MHGKEEGPTQVAPKPALCDRINKHSVFGAPDATAPVVLLTMRGHLFVSYGAQPPRFSLPCRNVMSEGEYGRRLYEYAPRLDEFLPRGGPHELHHRIQIRDLDLCHIRIGGLRR